MDVFKGHGGVPSARRPAAQSTDLKTEGGIAVGMLG